LLKTRGKYGQDISVEDIQTAINKLKLLGTGIQIHGTGDHQIVQSVPGELNMDHTAVLDFAQKNKAKVSVAQVMKSLSWQRERATRVLDHLVREGMVWIDVPAPNKQVLYWFPVFFVENRREKLDIPNEEA